MPHEPLTIALVTGAAKGIGLASTQALLQRGHRVVMVDQIDFDARARGRSVNVSSMAAGARSTLAGASYAASNLGTRIRAAVAAAALIVGPTWAYAWPERDLTLIVNYGAGGATDAASRALAKAIEPQLGRTVIVENKAGAQGTLGPAHVARQRADGYTVGVVTYSTIAITPHLMNVPYTAASFDFVAGYGRFRYGVVVRSESPYESLADLIAAAKTGRSLFFGAPSAPNNLALFELGRKTGATFEQVSYKSGMETVVALLSGQVEVIVQNPSDVMPHIKAGKLRLLASASPVRWSEMPHVPTLREAGYDVEIDSWLGLAVPQGTPRSVVEVLQTAVQAAMKSPELMRSFANIGVDPVSLSGREYLDMLTRGYEQMGKAIKEANLPRIN